MLMLARIVWRKKINEKKTLMEERILITKRTYLFLIILLSVSCVARRCEPRLCRGFDILQTPSPVWWEPTSCHSLDILWWEDGEAHYSGKPFVKIGYFEWILLLCIIVIKESQYFEKIHIWRGQCQW